MNMLLLLNSSVLNVYSCVFSVFYSCVLALADPTSHYITYTVVVYEACAGMVGGW